VPFQNAVLVPDEYLLVKNYIDEGGRKREELRIECFKDSSLGIRPNSQNNIRRFEQQKDKNRHPNSKFGIDQPLNEQIAKYRHHARTLGYGPEHMRAHSTKI